MQSVDSQNLSMSLLRRGETDGVSWVLHLTLFDSGADFPHHHVYACVYAYKRAIFFLLFLILSMEEGTTLLTPKQITVFPGTPKVGPICPTFIRGDPYDLIDPLKKSLLQTISWGSSRYLKVVNPHV